MSGASGEPVSRPASGPPPGAGGSLPTRRRFLIIRNRRAGTDNRRLVAAVVDALQARGATAAVIETERIEELDGAIRANDGIDAVVAAGGDGTLRALARAAISARLDKPLGLLPVGTGNVMARELGLPRKPTALADALMHGEVVATSVASANGDPFLAMCGAGFDAMIVHRLSQRLKQRIGRAAYTLPTLGALRQPPRLFDVEVDGRAHRASWVVAANARHYGGAFVIAPGASLTSPQLHAVLLKATTLPQRIAELLAIASGRMERCATIETLACRQLRISAPEGRLPIEIDGDDAGAVRHVEIRADVARLALIGKAVRPPLAP